MPLIVLGLIILVVIAVVVGIGVVAVLLANNSRRAANSPTELYPGAGTDIPPSWALGHDPEARLHRRMRDCLTALREASSVDAGFIDARVRLELAAAELDRRLIAVAPLRIEVKQPTLTQAGAAVAQLEDVTAQLLATRTLDTRSQDAVSAAVTQLTLPGPA